MDIEISHHETHVNGVDLHYVLSGEGDPIILLHGFPQSWTMWRYVIPALSREHRVAAIDLRGYGDSGKLPAKAGHDQRTKASDVRALVEELGFKEFVMIGHDRGARVTRRFALDYPSNLMGIALLDILPSEYVYDELSAAQIAQRYWHWVFQVVEDLPERLIEGNEDIYLERFFKRAPGLLEKLRRDGAYDEYLRCFCQPGAVAAAMNDYRATFQVDVPRYREERDAGMKVDVPTLLMWGERGNLSGLPVEEIWREVATQIHGAVEIPDCGHYLPEEWPEIVTEHLLQFTKELFR